MTQPSSFRYDINALRAIAVIGVILFHYKVPFFGGGFSGVDVFFIISGYLMTKIVISGLESDKFSIGDFYKKRAQRIIPALHFLILILLLVNFFIYIPQDYQLLAKNAAASVLFFSNILYYNSNYFDASSDTNALLHTWSLSVEWQFYLLLPLFLSVISKLVRMDRQKYLILFALITMIVFIGTLLVTRRNPNASFYLLPTRSWEMLLGGIVFLGENRIVTNWKKILASFGYIAIFLCFYGLNNRMSWPGLFTLLPVFATFLVISANLNQNTLLRNTGIQFLGKISYSLYLWHWPIYVIGGYLGIQSSIPATICYIGLSLFLAYLSYKYVESIKFENRLTLITATVALGAATFFISYENINNIAFKPESVKVSNYRKDHEEEHINQFGVGKCFVTEQQKGLKDYNATECLTTSQGRKNYLLIGDSHSAHLSQSLRETFEKLGATLSQASASGCLPLLKLKGHNRCVEVMHYVYYDYLPAHRDDIDGVIISANWVGASDKKILVTDIKNTIKYIRSLGINVVILGQNETYSIPFSSIAARELESGRKLSNRYMSEAAYNINKYLQKEMKPYYIDIYNLANVPKLSKNYIPYMYDQNHFTKNGADLVTLQIVKNKKFLEFID